MSLLLAVPVIASVVVVAAVTSNRHVRHPDPGDWGDEFPFDDDGEPWGA